MQKETEIFNTDIKHISRSVLVIGGAGYIGSHLCRQLEKNGYVPVVVDRNLKNKPRNNRNEPSYLPHIAEEIATVMEINKDKLIDATYKNSMNFFS